MGGCCRRAPLALSALLGAGLGHFAGCGAAAFACQTDGQCDGGSCIEGSCAFADNSCDSGTRFGDHTEDGRAGTCTPVSQAGSSGGPGGTSPPPTTGSLPTSTGTSLGAQDASSGGETTTTITSVTDGTSGDSGPGTTATTSGTGEDPSLVAWYRCEGDGGDIALDSSDNGLHGTCSDCPEPTEGIDGGGCLFNEDSMVIEVEYSPALDLEVFTLAAWARPDPLLDGSLSTIAAKPVGPGERNSYEIGFNFFGPQEVALMCYGSETHNPCYSSAVTTGQWMHIAMTYDGRTARLYIDGEQTQDGPTAKDGIVVDDSPLLIGRDLDNGQPAHPMRGVLDDIRLYSRALDPDEIAALAQ